MEGKDYSKYTVLVVDDIPVNVILLKNMLASMKCNIVSANNGQDALDEVAQHKPDIILMDVLMPGMNGYECTRKLKANQQTKDIPVVMVSALVSDADVKEGLAAGASDFIVKPLIKEKLVSSVTNQIDKAEFLKKQNRALPTEKALRDGFTSLLTYMACSTKTVGAGILKDFVVGIPMELIDTDLVDEMAKTVSSANAEMHEGCLLALAAKRINGMTQRLEQLLVYECVNDAVGKFGIILNERRLTVECNIAEDMRVETNPRLFGSIIINMMLCACRLSTDSILKIEAQADEGILTVVMRGSDKSKDVSIDGLNIKMAQDMAERLNGALITDRPGDGTFFFQLIIQV